MTRLMREEPTLSLETTAITGERTIAADDAMARHNNGDRVCAICKADGAGGVRLANLLGDRAIARRRACGNGAQCLPDLTLKVAAACGGRDRVDALDIAVEIASEGRGVTEGARFFRHRNAIVAPFQDTPPTLGAVVKLKDAQRARRVGNQEERADGRLDHLEDELLRHGRRPRSTDAERHRRATAARTLRARGVPSAWDACLCAQPLGYAKGRRRLRETRR